MHNDLRRQKRIVLCLFLFLPLLLLAVFSLYPAAKLIELSFTNWDGIAPDYNYVGLRNYIKLFASPDVFRTLSHNFAYFCISIIQTCVGLYFAIVLNSKMRGRNFYKSSIFMPYILNGVAVAFMFSFMYNFETSPINQFLRWVGLEEYCIRWLDLGYFSNFSLAFIGFWKCTGFAMVVFLGALQSIPVDYYEAAELDGANFWQKTRYITFPHIKTVVELNLFLSINGALQAYYEPFIITKGGPAGATTTFVIETVETAFTYNRFGEASAMGVVLMAIVICVVALQKMFIRTDDDV